MWNVSTKILSIPINKVAHEWNQAGQLFIVRNINNGTSTFQKDQDGNIASHYHARETGVH